MTRKKLDKLKREMTQCRHSPQKPAALEGLARRLGRRLVKRGKEPMWESVEFDHLYVLSIPHHGGKDLAIGTKNSILDQLEDDVLAWEKRLEKMDGNDGDDNGAD